MRVLLILLLLASVQAAAAPIRGAGAGSCGDWIEDRKHNHGEKLHWIQGFISGYNHFSYDGSNPDGVFSNVDPNSIAAWMDNYCARNPLSSPYGGAVELIKELRARSG